MPAAYEQQNQAFAQALAQQQQEEQLKAQILQALGFSKNPNPFGAIPQGAGAMSYEGSAYVRPGGIDQRTQQLLQSLLGLQQSGHVSGLQDPQSLGMQGGGIPQTYDPKKNSPAETGIQAINQNPQMLDFYLRLYPEIQKILVGGNNGL